MIGVTESPLPPPGGCCAGSGTDTNWSGSPFAASTNATQIAMRNRSVVALVPKLVFISVSCAF
jgi:hypothetical protein